MFSHEITIEKNDDVQYKKLTIAIGKFRNNI